MNKLQQLSEIEGMSIQDMLEDSVYDGVARAICKNKGCDYVTEMEPDQDQGYCEECGTNTVISCIVLAGMI